MLRMIRLHGNAVEYIPLALVLMAIYELNGGWHIGAAHRRHRAGRRAACCKPGTCGRREIAGFGRSAGQSLTWLSIAGAGAAESVAKLA